MANETQSGSQRGASGNIGKDRDKARDEGKKGGEHSHSGSQHSGSHESGAQQGGSQRETGGSRGGAGSSANDREKVNDAGKKGS